MTTQSYSGGCQCGAVRFRAMELFDNAHLCHCRMCQKAVGNVFAALVSAPKEKLTWTRGTPGRFMSSANVERGFCPKCGTPLFYDPLKSEDIGLCIGAFDEPRSLVPISHDSTESRMPWFSEITAIRDAGTSEQIDGTGRVHRSRRAIVSTRIMIPRRGRHRKLSPHFCARCLRHYRFCSGAGASLAGHEVISFARAGSRLPEGLSVRIGDVTDPASIAGDGFRGERFDAVVSCMASRSGLPRDAWAVDHQAHLNVLEVAKAHGVKQYVLLSAICVQKPKLAFQHAKLAFEAELIASGMTYSIVRPTAYFKSLSGQVARTKAGKPFLLFGDGRLTACKPISDRDLALYLANCLDDPLLQNAVLPIGGPGPAMTPLEQGEQLFALLGRKPKFRRVPVAMMDVIIRVLSLLGWRDKAELARIGKYYATESMLVWDAEKGRYEADATPSFGSDRLIDFQARLISGEETLNLGEHAVF